MLINRIAVKLILDTLAGEPKVIVLYGPRQSGKTVILHEIADRERKNGKETLFLKGDDIRVQEIFSVADYDKISKFIGNPRLLIIDEAQKIENIGSSLKLLFDSRPIHIIASGSASFDLAKKVNEPLTGRATFFTAYPLSVDETSYETPNFSLSSRLEDFLRFGMYPKVHTLPGEKEKEEYLYDMINTYLYQDLLVFGDIKKPKKILDLLSLLSLQLGSEVILDELSRNLSLHRSTIEKYLDVLEKMFIVINIRGFSRNLRKEISKTSKYYFTDLGLRNAIIRNFSPLKLRPDTGALFENFGILERIKLLSNTRKQANFYFWRTYDQKEIDFIEERGGRIKAFEFKYRESKISRATKQEFLKTYPNSDFTLINTDNIEEFLT